MTKLKKILIAVDSGPSSVRVIEEGFKLAKVRGAEVIFLHVLINMLTYTLTYLRMDPLKLESFEEIKISSKEFIDKNILQPENNIIQTTVKQGDFALSILNASKEMTIDLLVMGSHNSIWLEEIVMGRVTNEVLQLSKIPILIIPIKKNNQSNIFLSMQNLNIMITNQA